ncbi:MAG: hypothetical protein IKN43_13720 [Selenomonadaceae bacterium]|nr:hypothetical protein [Selenomonadaceae bacterium]
MKKILPLVFALMLAFSASAFAQKGTVVYYNAVSKVTVCQSFMGYSCGYLESVDFGPKALFEGDELDGHFGLGSHEFDDLTDGRKVRLDLKAMSASKESAKKWVEDNDKKNSLW